MTRRQRLEQAFAAHGVTDIARLESHIGGCDLARPVIAKALQRGDLFEVWVRDGGVPGKFGAPVGEDPLRLGIMIERRHREIFAVRNSLGIVACTAAKFPAGLIERVGGEGGGTQYILPPSWLKSVERIR